MKTSKITAKRAIELLTDIVDELGPDYVYPGANFNCEYVSEYREEPSCLIGRALYRYGVSIKALKKLDRRPYPTWDGIVKDGEKPVRSTDRADRAFAAAQVCQDVGDTYGEALAAARRVAGLE